MNNQLYQASMSALTENGIPQELAEKVSSIVANDNPDLPNFGRSKEDQQAVNQVVTHLNKEVKS